MPTDAVTAPPSPVRTKIRILTNRMDIGGTERHLARIVPLLNDGQFDVELWTLYSGGRLESEVAAAGVRVVNSRVRSITLQRIVMTARLLWSLSTERRCVFHFFLPQAYLVGGLCGALVRHPRMIMSRRSLNNYQKSHPTAARIERWLHKSIRLASGNSLAVIAQLQDEGIEQERTALIYNGLSFRSIDERPPRQAVRDRLGIRPDAFVMICVANLIAYKGHKDLIRALALAREALPADWHLLCVGRDQGLRPNLEAYTAEAGLNRHVRFLGERDDVAALLGAADVKLLVSHEEGFSNALLEAMACGLAVVGTRVGGTPEAIEDGLTGFLVAPGAPRELANVIVKLALSPSLRETVGRAAAVRVREQYSIENCLRNYKLLYERLLCDGRSRAHWSR